jgi:hypothetical protein
MRDDPLNAVSENADKYLVVKPNGGMGNRMLCAITGILYGRLTGRQTIIDWRDQAYSSDGSNTFGLFFQCLGVHPETILPAGASIRPKVWEGHLDWSVSDMLHRYDPDKHSSVTIHRKYSIDVRRLDYPETIIVFWNYQDRLRALRKHLHVLDPGFAGLSTYAVVRKVLTETMRLNDTVRRKVEEFKATHWPGTVIGLHIRHSDRRTELAKYERCLHHVLRRHPDAHIFLATDNSQVQQDYARRYENLFSTPKWYPDGMDSMHQNAQCCDRAANGIEALIDMYLLAQCDFLIFPSVSTFSLISAILSDAPADHIMDIDRFNLRVRVKRVMRELIW